MSEQKNLGADRSARGPTGAGLLTLADDLVGPAPV